MSLRIHGSVDLDGAGWESGLKRMEGITEHVTSHIKGMIVGALGTAAIEAAIHRTIEYGDKIVDTSRRIGVGIEALQEFGYAARQNGADIDALTGFIERLNSARIDPKKAQYFQSLGIDAGDLQSMKVEDLMMKLSDNVRGRSSQEIIGPLRQIGGRAAGEMIPMLKDELGVTREEARHLGVVLSSDTAVKLQFLSDEFKVLGQSITVGLAPAIMLVFDLIQKLIPKVSAAKSFWVRFDEEMAQYGAKHSAREIIAQLWAGKDSAWLKAFEAAGAASETTRIDTGSALQQMIDGLSVRQKSIEDINNMPDFLDIGSSGGKDTKSPGRQKELKDSLVAVGNFLGTGRSAIEDISRQQLELLRIIARNTSPGSSGGVGVYDMSVPQV